MWKVNGTNSGSIYRRLQKWGYVIGEKKKDFFMPLIKEVQKFDLEKVSNEVKLKSKFHVNKYQFFG